MKPLRILGMVEEAAGTSIYDRRKSKAKQRLSENEAKLTELDKVHFIVNIDMYFYRQSNKHQLNGVLPLRKAIASCGSWICCLLC